MCYGSLLNVVFEYCDQQLSDHASRCAFGQGDRWTAHAKPTARSCGVSPIARSELFIELRKRLIT